MGKDRKQKYEISLYKENDRYYAIILDNNHEFKFIIKKKWGKNKEMLIRNCFYYLEQKAIENKKRYGYLFHDYIASVIENF